MVHTEGGEIGCTESTPKLTLKYLAITAGEPEGDLGTGIAKDGSLHGRRELGCVLTTQGQRQSDAAGR